MIDKETIKSELVNYQPTTEERLAIRSAIFNFITLATVGAASLGMSARLWARSRSFTKRSTGIPTILGTFTGLTLGGALGMDRGMHKLRESLSPDSELLRIIRDNDQLKKETLLSGPIPKENKLPAENMDVQIELLEDLLPEEPTDIQMELIEDQLSKTKE